MNDYELEYHEGMYAVGNDIPFDETKSQAWKDGWNDGYGTLNGSEFDIDISKLMNM